MRGASALQKVLDESRAARLRVFVVWEPVLFSDVAPPTSGVLSRVFDERAAQYWDRDRILSKEIVKTAMSDAAHTLHDDELNEGAVVWDFVAIYPAGIRWDAGFPSPEYHGYPLVDVMDEVRQRLVPRQGEPERLHGTPWRGHMPASSDASGIRNSGQEGSSTDRPANGAWRGESPTAPAQEFAKRGSKRGTDPWARSYDGMDCHCRPESSGPAGMFPFFGKGSVTLSDAAAAPVPAASRWLGCGGADEPARRAVVLIYGGLRMAVLLTVLILPFLLIAAAVLLPLFVVALALKFTFRIVAAVVGVTMGVVGLIVGLVAMVVGLLVAVLVLGVFVLPPLLLVGTLVLGLWLLVRLARPRASAGMAP